MLAILIFMVSLWAATPVPHAVCTQIEPTAHLNGVSYYAGDSFCTLLAAAPEVFEWPTAPLDPAPLGMPAVCWFYISDAHTEYAVAWSVAGYEFLAVTYCQRLAANGVAVNFVSY